MVTTCCENLAQIVILVGINKNSILPEYRILCMNQQFYLNEEFIIIPIIKKILIKNNKNKYPNRRTKSSGKI